MKMMTDKERARTELSMFHSIVVIPQMIHDLYDIVQRNQNPGCGGDGSLSQEEWTEARDAVDAVDRAYRLAERVEKWKR